MCFARKGSGSYYTPDDLVEVILKETVGPAGPRAARGVFPNKPPGRTRSGQTVVSHTVIYTDSILPSGLLDLKICDPAMGSGHFLVSLVGLSGRQRDCRLGRGSGHGCRLCVALDRAD